MASNLSLCGVCDNCHITNPSEVWCSECEEGLCKDCKEHHGVSKGTKHHATVSIVDYNKLPTEILQIAQVCEMHNRKYEIFCRNHDCLCCKCCLKYHKGCKGVTDINKVIKNVKTSNAFHEIDQSLLETVVNIKRIISNREDNLTSLVNQKIEIEDEIKQTRTKINNHLDKLQNDLMKELMATEQKESSKIRKLLTSLKQKEQKMAKYQANVANIKQYASELQTFLSMKHIQKDMAIEDKFIQSLIKSDTTDQVSISCKINKSLQQIIASGQKFGEINVSFELCNVSIQIRKHKQAQIMVALSTRNIDSQETTDSVQKFGDRNVSSARCDLAIQKQKDRQAQIMVALPTRNIHKLTLTLLKRINTGLSEVRGCSMLPNGRMVFSCYYQKEIKVLKSGGSTDFEIKTIDHTFDVAFIGNDSIAVTSAESDKINIIDIKKHKLKRPIKVNSGNYGVVYKDEHLIYCSRKKGLKMISLNDESIANVLHDELPPNAYVTTFDDRLIYTKGNDNSVTCCDYHGNILWTFCDTSVLIYPLGISVDNGGNVFVVGYATHNVVVISPDGQRHRQLLSRRAGLVDPTVLHYDQCTNTLLVATSKGDASVYNVK
ncbi:unnamed protein product [Mytilus coruscus]|uniref:B box-type domain-containing protein n=1 Tax=Mytilus coruscus TaxID=42192 RepID=A0A6J7ZY48_MYTCO|nr:unnamed protein product [Mytilus coruscus]